MEVCTEKKRNESVLNKVRIPICYCEGDSTGNMKTKTQTKREVEASKLKDFYGKQPG